MKSSVIHSALRHEPAPWSVLLSWLLRTLALMAAVVAALLYFDREAVARRDARADAADAAAPAAVAAESAGAATSAWPAPDAPDALPAEPPPTF